MNPHAMEVSELKGHLHPAVESAAMRFAGGYAAEARLALEHAVAGGAVDPRPWLTLLDLLRLEGSWSEHEALVGRYVAAFGDDPPAERERKRREAALPKALRTGGPACIALAGPLDSTAVATAARLRAAGARHSLVHVDATRLTSVEAAGVRLLEEALGALAGAGVGLILSGRDNLQRLLREALEIEPSRRAFWDLLLAVHRIAGDRQGFERIALEAALAAGLPAPPSWEPLLAPQSPPAARAERREEPRYGKGEVLVLAGVMAGENAPQLAALDRHAEGRDYVNIDLSFLERLDFVSAAHFADRVSALARRGCTVRLLRPNALVAALLELLNLGGVATIDTLQS